MELLKEEGRWLTDFVSEYSNHLKYRFQGLREGAIELKEMNTKELKTSLHLCTDSIVTCKILIKLLNEYADERKKEKAIYKIESNLKIYQEAYVCLLGALKGRESKTAEWN